MADPTLAELQAQIDRLNAELASKDSGGTDTPNLSTSSTPDVREPSSGATVIGAAPDARGGFVVGYSDGTVTLSDVPLGVGNVAAQPWGNAPEGTYTHFFVMENSYNFVEEGTPAKVVSVPNPSQVLPPGSRDPNAV
jgi:hypothetical protein